MTTDTSMDTPGGTDGPEQTWAPPRRRDPAPIGVFFSSKGWRLAVLIMLTVVMLIPLGMISLVIEDRVSYRRDAVRQVSSQWGGEVSMQGPILVLPVERERQRKERDENGQMRTETYWDRADPIILRPESLAFDIDAESVIRRRGIFEVPVYVADMTVAFDFDTARAEAVLHRRERILWTKAAIGVMLPHTRSFADHAILSAGDRTLALEPGTPVDGIGGIQAATGDPRKLGALTLTMRLNGAREITLSPAGRQTDVRMVSNWAHPSFSGTFLPKDREVTDEGFSATWAVPHLARNIAQVSRSYQHGQAQFGVRFYNPVDLYQKAQRAVKYGILFVALTFLTVFLTERISGRRVHAAQFVLIGLTQCIFFLLLLSLAEQIGFTSAYLAATGATVGLIGFYGATGLGLRRKAWVLIGSLGALYGTLFLILRSTDYALLAGSLLAFIAIALVMILTRGDNWAGSGNTKPVGSGLERRDPVPT